MSSYRDALALQGRVLWALALREIHGRHGKSRLGYLWQIIKTGFGIGVMMLFRSFLGGNSIQGIPMPLFLLLGFVLYYLFSETVSKTIEAVETNKALLTFPQIQQLDLFLSSAVVSFVNELLVLVIFLVGLQFLGYEIRVINPLIFSLSFIGVWVMGFGVGLLCASLAFYLPVIEKIVPMVLRVMLIASGVFFSPLQLSAHVGMGIMLNPLANYIELMRGALLASVPLEGVRVLLTVSLTFIFLASGLLLERHVRSKEHQ